MKQRHYAAREGDEGEDIAFVQMLLQIAPATGVFDTRTVQRIKGFQVANGLWPNGVLTKETLDLLMARTEVEL